MFGRKQLKTYEYKKEELESFKYAKMTTAKGVIWLELYTEEVPNTVSNFVSLVEDGFYDGLNFHRVIHGFMAQGGCPNGTGTGGPDWAIECECSKNKHKHIRGTLSMAHAGPNTGGSQFFICFVPCPHLDGMHTVFGGIAKDDSESFKTLDAIEQQDTIDKVEILGTKE